MSEGRDRAAAAPSTKDKVDELFRNLKDSSSKTKATVRRLRAKPRGPLGRVFKVSTATG